MRLQSTSSKISEVKYRSIITKQQLGKSKVFANEPDHSTFKKNLKKKLKETEKLFKQLNAQGIPLTPFLEIGAENGLRSSLLKEKFKASGFASDISFFSLSKAKNYSRDFGLKKTAETLCADAYNLPFKSRSLPFVFIYESLHHFPDPKPIVQEIYRVLAPGGLCLIGGDPIKQSFQIKLWRRPNNLRSWEKLLKALFILPFASHIGKTEVEYGILEETISLKDWQDSLCIFKKVEAKIEIIPLKIKQKLTKTNAKNWLLPNLKTRIAIFFVGGGLKALCFKAGTVPKDLKTNLIDLLICPNCRKNYKKEIMLKKNFSNLICTRCQTKYQKYFGVLTLVEKNLEKKILGIQ